MTVGNESAFPYLDGDGHLTMSEIGLTKRELFAALALQGLMANPAFTELKQTGKLDVSLCEIAVVTADGLIAALNKIGN